MAKHDDAFTEMAGALAANEDKIVAELIECQGTPVDIGGYWKPDPKKVEAAMRAHRGHAWVQEWGRRALGALR